MDLSNDESNKKPKTDQDLQIISILCTKMHIHPIDTDKILSSVQQDNVQSFQPQLAKGEHCKATDCAQVKVAFIGKYMVQENIQQANDINVDRFCKWYDREIWFHDKTKCHHFHFINEESNIPESWRPQQEEDSSDNNSE